jgi:hypothetical protein
LAHCSAAGRKTQAAESARIVSASGAPEQPRLRNAPLDRASTRDGSDVSMIVSTVSDISIVSMDYFTVTVDAAL